MKKPKPPKTAALRPEYSRADFPDGMVRGKYATRIAAGSNVVVLEPKVAAAFPTSASVNSALRQLMRERASAAPAARAAKVAKARTAPGKTR